MASSKVFTLEGKGLKLNTAEDIQPYIKELVANPDVEEIHFHGNTLGVGASKALAEVLKEKKKLKLANLADIFTGRLLSEIPDALSALLTSLNTLPDLHTVNLSDNAFGLNTQAPLVEFLKAHTPLRHLILNNNGLGPAAGTLIADALSTLAEKKAEARKKGQDVPDLETVICGRNRLENGSMAAWAKAFSAHRGVREVKMVQNGIRQEGITLLLKQGLSHASNLRVLDLQDNTFTALGARALSDVVGGWEELRELGVGDCLLSGRGGVMLAESLRGGKNPRLEVLRLQYNEIDSKGLKGLADAQDKLPKLRRVELNGNRFSDEDEALDRLQEALAKVRDGWGEGAGEDDEFWGIDELDELEEESEEESEAESEAEEEQEEGVSAKDKAEEEVKRAEEAEQANVPQEKDKGVDELADMLGKTELK